MLKAIDFKFDHVDRANGYLDCYFEVSGDSEDEILRRYGGEQGMVGVRDVIYSILGGETVIRRNYVWNYDAIEVTGKYQELTDILRTMALQLKLE